MRSLNVHTCIINAERAKGLQQSVSMCSQMESCFDRVLSGPPGGGV